MNKPDHTLHTLVDIDSIHYCNTTFSLQSLWASQLHFVAMDLSKGTLFGVKHFLALAVASLFLKLKKCSQCGRERGH